MQSKKKKKKKKSKKKKKKEKRKHEGMESGSSENNLKRLFIGMFDTYQNALIFLFVIYR